MLKSKTSILVTSDNMGRMNMYGYVKENNVFYRLDRALYFNYQSIDKKNNYSIRFKTLSITSSDNVPQALFANFIQLEEEKINYYINVTKMNDNIYIIKDEAYSSFTCYADK
ncbi:FidL-like protein [Providencia sp. PROV152]|nr:FidL-like protein [Providencia sp. PROV152]